MKDEQRIFFKKNKIPFELTYNANELPITEEIQEKMKVEGKAFAYNTSPCENEGHTISERSGNCVQCKTTNINLMLKSISYGCVYIAASSIGQMIKIGSTRIKEIKSDLLNKTKFGGYNDWEILYSFYCLESGKMEGTIQTELSRYSSTVQYDNEANLHKAAELFRCGYPKAKEAALKAPEELNIQALKISEATSLLSMYNFRNLARSVK